MIDPLPGFDPEEHSRRFPGRYIFHRDISHNVLPDLPAVDAALVDGDHNWFTVYHELRMLREAAEARGAPDAAARHARRLAGRTAGATSTTSPSRIPDEFRQPYARRGLLPGRRDLRRQGGINPHLANAIEEGGPRNGVTDGTGRLRRRVRRLAARRAAAALLRPRDRRARGAADSAPATRARCSTGSRAMGAATS